MKQVLLSVLIGVFAVACHGQSATDANGGGTGGEKPPEPSAGRVYYSADEFVMGADLSYVNQILDHGGTYRDSSGVEDPYKIFSDYGANVVRLRLWHDPEWTRTVYEGNDNPMYNDLKDVTRAMQEAKKQGMAVNLDIHYSDRWADPENQNVPKAWLDITSLDVLKDSVYNYTAHVLRQLNSKGLMPEYVQVGNETNCGMLITNAPDQFPALNVCDGNWSSAGAVFNSGIKAVRDVASEAGADTRIILHIAQPENVEWWFENMTGKGGVSDFDIIGFSYYSPWSDVALGKISDYVSTFKTRFGKEVMIAETAYPWTLEDADSYSNIFGQSSLVAGYPATIAGQESYMTDLTQEVIDGGGTGVMYWEPAWISSDMKDLWGTGSAWDNNTFFDFQGKVHAGINYMTHPYNL